MWHRKANTKWQCKSMLHAIKNTLIRAPNLIQNVTHANYLQDYLHVKNNIKAKQKCLKREYKQKSSHQQLLYEQHKQIFFCFYFTYLNHV